jgi:hypothetical protein
MRNIFDQFLQPENRLTHALMCALHEDAQLLAAFIRWATGGTPPRGAVRVLEQSLPGEDPSTEQNEQQRRGLPDGWIHNDDGWSLLIESKIACRLEENQIRRHRWTAQKRGFTQVHVLMLVAESPDHLKDEGLRVRRWTELYLWLKSEHRKSEWARRLHNYMDVLEAKLVTDEYLKAGTLTVFTGFPFDRKSPYNYLEAKRLLRLAMDELRQRPDLRKAFDTDTNAVGRAAITGHASSSVWDYLTLGAAANAKNFTEYPHLTLGVHREFIHAIVIVPNGIRSEFRRTLLGGGEPAFRETISKVLDQFVKRLSSVKGAVPWIELVQRRYPSQRSEPFVDALLEFDLRTAFPTASSDVKTPKLQPQWLSAVFAGLSERGANLQLAVGVRFSYDQCPETKTRAILDSIAQAWISCKPLVETLLGS